jgi:hypothetical protein
MRRFVVASALAVSVLAVPSPASAHGVGERGDLPLDLVWALTGAAIAVVFSFAALGVLWEKPKLANASRLRAAGALQAQGVGAWLLRLSGLVMTGVVLIAALTAGGGPQTNVSLVAVYVIFWVGVPVVSSLVGDLWRLVSPFETVAVIARQWVPKEDKPDDSRLDWLAIVPLAAFLWLELAYHDNASPRIVGLFVFAYSLGILMVLFARGADTMRAVEGFGIFFHHLSLLSPVGRDIDGKLGLRMPLAGATTLQQKRSAMVLLLVVLGGTTFDGLSRTVFWNDNFVGQKRGWSLTVTQTLGLFFVIAVVVLLYYLGSTVGARIAGQSTETFAAEFGHTLIPIALAYAVAHYFSLFVFEGQLFLKLLSDPFNQGWDLFGTADWTVNFLLVSTDTIGWVQVFSIVVGHMIAVLLAHDRSLERYSPVVAFRSQFPMLVVMVIYTVGGLFLLAGA